MRAGLQVLLVLARQMRLVQLRGRNSSEEKKKSVMGGREGRERAGGSGDSGLTGRAA